ncbi:MAG: TerC family protein [Gammaproteobacteria bacterium]
MLEFFSPEWWAALGVIIAVDLLLAGDNAVVIALAARNLPPKLQKRAIIAGTFGAILVRIILVLFVFELLKLTGLRVIGGVLLFYVAWRLAAADDDGDRKDQKPAAQNFWQAMRTIIIADTVMGLDNILAIAGAADGDLTLVIIGFALSVPIMIGGSVIILRLMTKAPWLITAGAALLAGIGSRMILDDNLLSGFVAEVWQWPVILAAAAIFTAAILFFNNKKV